MPVVDGDRLAGRSAQFVRSVSITEGLDELIGQALRIPHRYVPGGITGHGPERRQVRDHRCTAGRHGFDEADPEALSTESEARRDVVLAMVRVIRALNHSIKDLDRAVIAHLGERPDAEVFRSLPRAGKVNAAQMLAEWGDCREAYDGPEAVAALSGMAPITRRSGKHLAVGFRWACNKRFRNAMTTFADNGRHASRWAAAVYQAAVDRGADHPHAVRILASRLDFRVIHRCWLDHVAYEPAKHRGAQRLADARR